MEEFKEPVAPAWLLVAVEHPVLVRRSRIDVIERRRWKATGLSVLVAINLVVPALVWAAANEPAGSSPALTKAAARWTHVEVHQMRP